MVAVARCAAAVVAPVAVPCAVGVVALVAAAAAVGAAAAAVAGAEKNTGSLTMTMCPRNFRRSAAAFALAAWLIFPALGPSSAQEQADQSAASQAADEQ